LHLFRVWFMKARDRENYEKIITLFLILVIPVKPQFLPLLVAHPLRVFIVIVQSRSVMFSLLAEVQVCETVLTIFWKFAEGVAEINKCALVCDYYADHSERMLEREHVDTGVQHRHSD